MLRFFYLREGKGCKMNAGRTKRDGFVSEGKATSEISVATVR